jgi:hypothetical protein
MADELVEASNAELSSMSASRYDGAENLTRADQEPTMIGWEATASVRRQLKQWALDESTTLAAVCADMMADAYKKRGLQPPPELALIGRKPRGRPSNADRA